MNMKATMQALTLERRQAATRLVNRAPQQAAEPADEEQEEVAAPAPKPAMKRYRRQGKRLVPVTA